MSELSAYHEAGHAVMAWRLGGRVQHVTIEPDDDDGPERYGDTQVRWRRSKFTAAELAASAVQVSLAGPVAEMIYTGDPFHPGLVAEWADDWRQAWAAAEPLLPDERKRLELLERTTLRLYRELGNDAVWAAIAAVADHLLAHDRLDREDLEDILRGWLG
jgi:hypothetical protein